MSENKKTKQNKNITKLERKGKMTAMSEGWQLLFSVTLQFQLIFAAG